MLLVLGQDPTYGVVTEITNDGLLVQKLKVASRKFEHGDTTPPLLILLSEELKVNLSTTTIIPIVVIFADIFESRIVYYLPGSSDVFAVQRDTISEKYPNIFSHFSFLVPRLTQQNKSNFLLNVANGVEMNSELYYYVHGRLPFARKMNKAIRNADTVGAPFRVTCIVPLAFFSYVLRYIQRHVESSQVNFDVETTEASHDDVINHYLVPWKTKSLVVVIDLTCANTVFSGMFGMDSIIAPDKTIKTAGRNVSLDNRGGFRLLEPAEGQYAQANRLFLHMNSGLMVLEGRTTGILFKDVNAARMNVDNGLTVVEDDMPYAIGSCHQFSSGVVIYIVCFVAQLVLAKPKPKQKKVKQVGAAAGAVLEADISKGLHDPEMDIPPANESPRKKIPATTTTKVERAQNRANTTLIALVAVAGHYTDPERVLFDQKEPYDPLSSNPFPNSGYLLPVDRLLSMTSHLRPLAGLLHPIRRNLYIRGSVTNEAAGWLLNQLCLMTYSSVSGLREVLSTYVMSHGNHASFTVDSMEHVCLLLQLPPHGMAPGTTKTAMWANIIDIIINAVRTECKFPESDGSRPKKPYKLSW